MLMGEDEEECKCDPCNCETPEEMSRAQSKLDFPEDEEEEEEEIHLVQKRPGGYQLDEFVRAKEYFLQASPQSGLTLYDHLSEVIRKLLDTRSPPNAVDFLEEISMNVKRYRFGVKKDILRDVLPIPPEQLEDSKALVGNWKNHAQWSAENAEIQGEDRPTFGGFPNLMRLLYYLEQINVGLPQEEMFRIALSLRQLIVNKPIIIRARFWGKVIGLYKSYYIVEAELSGIDEGAGWVPPSEEEVLHPEDHIPEYEAQQLQLQNPETPGGVVVPGAGATFERAGFAVTDPEILAPYQETSGLPPEVSGIIVPKQTNEFENEYYGEGATNAQYDNPEAASELARWHQYQHELMTGFPVPPKPVPEVEIQAEPKGVGLNRRTFYVTTDLSKDWLVLPDVTPAQISGARKIRWFLTGNLEGKIITLPEYPGREGHYLRAQLARITAGAMVSPRGYFRTRKLDTEYDDEDEDEEDIEEEEEEERMGDDTVYPMKKYKPPPMMRLLDPSMEVWVHHTNYILRQGRVLWWNPKQQQKKELGEGGEDDEDLEDEEEEEESRDREFGPPLFKSLTEDKSLDGVSPWSTRASSSVFAEFQVVCARSNLWPGSTAMCTSKGKVETIYVGDGLKFFGHTYAPFVPEETGKEYKEGPELKEDFDPTAEFEQAYLKKLELKEIADIEEPFVDYEGEEEEDETELEDYTDED